MAKNRRRRRQFQKRSARPPKSPDLDVVIPVYGQPDLLAQCIEAVEINCLDIDYRLIVVDDASPNQIEMAPIYAALNSKSARLVAHKRNMGFPAACNDGAARGNAPAILFLNSDVILQLGAIKALLDTLWRDDLPEAMIAPHIGPIGVVGPKLLFPDDNSNPSWPAGKIQHAGLTFNLSGQATHANIGWSADHPKINILRGVQAVTGACLATRRETWDKVTQSYRQVGDPSTGGFNLVYGRGTYEDIEYCFAARGHGYRVVYQPKAMGYHRVGASAIIDGKGYPLRRNNAIFKARCGHLIIWDEWMWY